VTWLAGWSTDPPTLAAIAAGACAYAAGVARLRGRGDHWSPRRSLSFASGLALVTIALVSPLASHDGQFAVHTLQHLLVGMIAPLLLALAAPITLTLRILPATSRRRLLRVLHHPIVRLASAPSIAALLAVGTLYGLYLTPLYAATLTNPLLHLAVHAHFFLAGCLLTWSLVGLDPIAHRPSFRHRAVVLLVAMAAHATLAKLLYASPLPGVPLAAADRQLGAQLLWYGGDLIDLALLVVFFSQWYAAGGRELARQQRHQSSPAASTPRSSPNGPPVGEAMPAREMWNGGEAASWCSAIARECAPGPQGRPNRPPSTISPGVGRRRRPIDGQ
jgi:putative membrane protein